MNNDQMRMEVYGILMTMAPAEALKRLRPIGSGATTCFAGREADGGTSLADEERSDREDRRVSPGEAEAMERYCKEVAACNMAYAHEHADKGQKQLSAYYAGIAAGWETAAVVLPYFHERAGAGQRCDEGASGRRTPGVWRGN